MFFKSIFALKQLNHKIEHTHTHTHSSAFPFEKYTYRLNWKQRRQLPMVDLWKTEHNQRLLPITHIHTITNSIPIKFNSALFSRVGYSIHRSQFSYLSCFWNMPSASVWRLFDKWSERNHRFFFHLIFLATIIWYGRVFVRRRHVYLCTNISISNMYTWNIFSTRAMTFQHSCQSITEF